MATRWFVFGDCLFPPAEAVSDIRGECFEVLVKAYRIGVFVRGLVSYECSRLVIVAGVVL